jgi:hypothetical protein
MWYFGVHIPFQEPPQRKVALTSSNGMQERGADAQVHRLWRERRDLRQRNASLLALFGCQRCRAKEEGSGVGARADGRQEERLGPLSTRSPTGPLPHVRSGGSSVKASCNERSPRNINLSGKGLAPIANGLAAGTYLDGTHRRLAPFLVRSQPCAVCDLYSMSFFHG